MLKSLFEQQKNALNHFFHTIDIAAAEAVFEKVHSCSGIILLSGVGKSGHIAEKISTTLNSTGTRSAFISAAHALHGDLGFVTAQDLFLVLSKNGESQELLDLLPYVKKKGAFTIAVVSRPQSRLEKMADLSLFLPVERELCPYDLAPTTSTTVQLLFGDCLAVALMKAKNFSVDAFAANHPAGFLGRKITLTVSDLMLTGDALPLGRPEDFLIDVLHELSAKRCGCLLVCDPNLKGIFTDGDLRRAIEAQGAGALQAPLSSLMTSSPRTTTPQQLAFDAMRQMEENLARPITVLPVLEGEKVVGLLRMHEIIQSGLRACSKFKGASIFGMILAAFSFFFGG